MGSTTASVLPVNQGTIRFLNEPSDPATGVRSIQERPVLLMSEQGLGDTLQFSRYALHLQQQGFDVTLLSQPALVPLLRDAIGLKVVDQIECDHWAKREPIWLPLLNLLPTLQAQKLWAPFSSGYLQVEAERIHRWSTLLQRKPRQRLIALHWQGIPATNTLSTREVDHFHSRNSLVLGQLADVEFVSIQKGAGRNKSKPTVVWTLLLDRQT